MKFTSEIRNQTFEEERSLYNSKYLLVDSCKFSGPADGESPLKESDSILVINSHFDLRYSFWHVTNSEVKDTTFSNTARAPFWYCTGIGAKKIESDAVKIFRECNEITVLDSTFNSEEPFWRCNNLTLKESKLSGFYAFLSQIT